MTLNTTYAPDAAIASSDSEASVLAVGAGERVSLGSLLSQGMGRRILVRLTSGSLAVGKKAEVAGPGQAFMWEAPQTVEVLCAPVRAIALVMPADAAPRVEAGCVLPERGELARAVDDLVVAWTSGDEEVLRERAIELVRAVASSGADGTCAPVARAAVQRDSVARAVREIMDERLSCPPTIPELAESCGVSPTVLKEAFRSEFGLPVYEWCRRLRMVRAADLLADGMPSVGEAARAVGYANASKFARAFSEVIGVSPSEWASDWGRVRRARLSA